MSKKKLSRSIIEGGRVSRNKWERRDSHNKQRASERDYCKAVINDVDNADVKEISKKVKVHKEFDDKLGGVVRWLAKQVNRPWDNVYSEIKTKFDVRTTAGRHVVEDHLIKSVEFPNDPWSVAYDLHEKTSYYPNHFYVDDEGILRVKTQIPRYNKAVKFETDKIAVWLNGRVVGQVGSVFYWFIPCGNWTWTCTWGKKPYYGWARLTYYYLSTRPTFNKDGQISGREEYWMSAFSPYSMRQGLKLSKEDLKFWHTIPEFYQTKVLERSPVYTYKVNKKDY